MEHRPASNAGSAHDVLVNADASAPDQPQSSTDQSAPKPLDGAIELQRS
jgi:hypothetical protein